MASVRNAHLARLLIGALGACSSGTPSTGGPVNGVLGVEVIPCNNGDQCVDENISDVTIDDGGALFSRMHQGGSTSRLVTILRANFDDGGVATLTDDPNANEAYVGVTGAGDFYVANDQTLTQLTVHNANGSGAEQVPSGGILAGSLGVAGGFYFAAGNGNGGSGDLNSGTWPNGIVIDGGVASNELSGHVSRFVPDAGFTQLSADFLSTYTRHVLATDGTNVYWIAKPAPGTVMSAPMDLSTATPGVAIPEGIGMGVAANATAVFWGSTSFASTPLCAIGSGATANVFRTTSFSCLGVAVDDTYAYFAVVHLEPLQGNANSSNVFLAGTAIARVALAGPSTQTPKLVDVSSTRWYGARRVLLDAKYVYGIDPSYIARLPKSAFD